MENVAIREIEQIQNCRKLFCGLHEIVISRNYQIVQFAGNYNENTCGAQNGLSGNLVNIELHRVRMNEEFDIEW